MNSARLPIKYCASCPSQGAEGFTLLELLIAMTLLGILLVMLFGGLRLGQRAWDRGSEEAETSHTLSQVDRFLRRTLAQAQPIKVRKEKRQVLTFMGQEDTLLFTAPLPAQAASPGLYWIEIAFSEKRLLLRFKPYDPARKAMEGEFQETVLLEGLKGGAFRYFGEEGWQNTWEEGMRLPTKVALALDMDFPWPEMVLPLRHSAYTFPSFVPRRFF